jgi:ABC-2 type transport system ATP-binding protein
MSPFSIAASLSSWFAIRWRETSVQSILAVREVFKSFGSVRAVDGVSFTARLGAITGLLGRNGAGKTTCLRMITGVFLPDAGTIEIFGSSSRGDATRDRIGYLPEERGLYRKMKVLEHLLFFAEVKRPLSPEILSRAERWLKRLELWEKRDAKVEELSRGNQQKVQLIGALLHEPELVILDEPTSGLDPVNVVLVRRILKELQAEGRTILLSTHVMGEAEKMVDDIVLIHEGRVVLAGELGKVRASLGKNNVFMEFSGDGAFLSSLAAVEGSSIQTNRAELRLRAGADPQAILSASVERLRISRFEIAEPSLEEIFIDRVGVATLEANGAAP